MIMDRIVAGMLYQLYNQDFATHGQGLVQESFFLLKDPYLTPQNRHQPRQRDPQQSDDYYYYQQPGPSGAYRPRFYGGGSWGSSPQADHTAEYDQFTGGLSEEEQMRRAMEESVHEFRFRNGGGGLYPNVY